MKAPLAAALLALLAAPARADVVELRNGRILEGDVVSETDTAVTLRMEGGQVTFEKKLVSSIRREPKPDPSKTPPPPAPAPAPAPAPGPAPAGFVVKPAAPDEIPGITPSKEDWLLLWSAERRVGWRHTEARVEDSGAGTFEEETTWLGPDGKPEGTLRIVEEAGPGFAPLAFLLVSDLPGRTYSRIGRMAAGRLSVETWEKGEKSQRQVDITAGLRFPLAARALVLRESGRAGAAWKGPVFDPRTLEVATVAFRAGVREKVDLEGAPVETLVLAREEGDASLEERVASDGRLLSADLDGAGLSAVGTTKARVDALRAGTAEDEASETERQGRMAMVCPEDGFRIRKPGVSWTLSAASARQARERASVKDMTGSVSVAVASDPAPAGPEPAPEDLAAPLEERLGRESTGFRRIEAGRSTLGGCPAWRLLADAVVNGDRVRLLVVTLARAGRVWTVTARAPADSFGEARPYLQRILDGIEWL